MFILLHGFLVGVLLSALRAPLGFSIVELPAVSGMTSAQLRAAVLLATSALMLPARPLFRRSIPLLWWLLGIFFGLASWGLFVLPSWQPSSRGQAGLVLLAALPLFWLLSGRGARDEHGRDCGRESLGLTETLAAVLAGAGVAISSDAIVRHARLFSLGLPDDDTLIGLLCALLLALGYLAFGRVHARTDAREAGRGHAAFAVGAALFGPACVIGLRFLGALDLEHFFSFLNRFGLDFTLLGTTRATVVVTAAACITPAFGLGLLCGGLTHPRRLRATLFGAAIGVLLTPLAVRAFSVPHDYLAAKSDPFAWHLAALGGALTLLGATASVLGIQGAKRRVIPVLAIAGGLLALTLGPRPCVFEVSPWLRSRVEPDLLLQTPEGLLSVESEYASLPTLIVTLDRKRLTPLSAEESIDRDRMAWSLSLLPKALRDSKAARVLFVGQMTPARAAVFRALGIDDLQRTAPWERSFGVIEEHLFADETLPPPGMIISPRLARARIAAEKFDLILVAPVHGPVLYPKSAQWIHWGAPPAPVFRGCTVPPTTTLVAWVDARSALANRTLGKAVIPAVADGMQHASFGIVMGKQEPGAGDLKAGRPILLPSGDPVARPSVMALLNERPESRNYTLTRLLTERFARAAAKEPMRGVARALAEQAEPQVPSSPFDSLAEQVELSEDALKELLNAARAAEPDPATRRIFEAFAWLLFERREIELTLTFLEPVASAYPPWPVLERVIARAYEEFGMPSEASQWLARVLERAPFDIALLAESAAWTARAGDPQGAAKILERALKLQPKRLALRRQLAMMWVRAGDWRAKDLLVELLREHPDDSEIARYLGNGPLPPLPDGFLPPEETQFSENRD